MDTNLDNLIQLRLEKLYNKKKDISEEIANIKKLMLDFPDLTVLEDDDNNVYYCSGTVNNKVNKVHWATRYDIQYVCCFMMFKNCRIYSNPCRFGLGSGDDDGKFYRNYNLKTDMESHNISEKLIQEILKTQEEDDF